MNYRTFLLNTARKAIETFVREGKVIPIPENCPEELKRKKGVFVTIYKKIAGKEHLRGCIGLPYPLKPLIEAVIEAAVSACKDPRFEPLREEELKDIFMEVSVLSKPELIEASGEKYLEKIKKGDGLIIKKGILSGLFLPQVWKEIPKKEDFLSNLCLKAGLHPDAWKYDKSIEIYRFDAEILKEKKH